MSEIRDILVEQVERLLADRSSPALLRAAEAGTWPEALWAEVESLGLPLAMLPEEQGGAGLGWGDSTAVWHVLGRHGAPVPLAESMAAGGLLAAAGIAAPAGMLALAVPREPGLPWGRKADHLVGIVDGSLVLHPATAHKHARQPISRLPYDSRVPGPRT
ncbi:MAG: hypothetical protein EON47_22455, partial [Acetobacteraceae bacterium]